MHSKSHPFLLVFSVAHGAGELNSGNGRAVTLTRAARGRRGRFCDPARTVNIVAPPGFFSMRRGRAVYEQLCQALARFKLLGA